MSGAYSYKLWKPAVFAVKPSGLKAYPFFAWWVMHYSRLFKNDSYGLFVVYDGEMLIHRSGVFPGYFRFPFMARDDLQIGDIWTHPLYRNTGLASFAVNQIIMTERKHKRRFWYVTEDTNLASIKLAERNGFVRFGEGIRRNRLGVDLLGSYQITDQYC